MTTPRRDDQQQERVPARWTIDRDLDAVAAHLDPWILAAEPDHDPATTAIPLLGTPEWVAADDTDARTRRSRCTCWRAWPSGSRW